MPIEREPDKENILFLDIETVPQFRNYELVPVPLQHLWEEKITKQKLLKENESFADAYGRAGLYAEFGKVVCIVVGFVEKEAFQLRSFSGDDEKKLLEEFNTFLFKFKEFRKKEIILCAHNGKEFDYPYMARRMIINRIKLPALLDNAGKKPWEVNLLDTLELWKFGDYKAYTSLNLMAYILGLPSPKQDMDGSMVGNAYYNNNGLEQIVRYCGNDVLTLANVYFRIKGISIKDYEFGM
jgi:predicted PolB exonuclease-like 3'-5' exonuclease